MTVMPVETFEVPLTQAVSDKVAKDDESSDGLETMPMMKSWQKMQLNKLYKSQRCRRSLTRMCGPKLPVFSGYSKGLWKPWLTIKLRS
jgi:hypothetical protein